MVVVEQDDGTYSNRDTGENVDLSTYDEVPVTQSSPTSSNLPSIPSNGKSLTGPGEIPQ